MRHHRYAGWLALTVLALSACGQPQPPATTEPTASSELGAAALEDFDQKPPPVPDTSTTTDAVDPGPSVSPVAEDCVSYNPSNLTVAASGDAWILKDGGHGLKLFDTKADAEDGRRVARNWTRLCFIGRGNDRPDRSRFIFTYFRVPSGLPLGPAPTFDCIAYDPKKLTIYSGAAHPANPAESAWALHVGSTPLLYLATEPDALRAKVVAAENRQLCLIGHGNTRPDPSRYIMEFWRP